jgi:hypothetical protein
MRKILLIIVLLSLPLTGFTAGNSPSADSAGSFTPIAFNDAKFRLENSIGEKEQIKTETEQKKSVALSVLFSAILPGAGEAYAKSYWRSALFIGIEAGLWSGYFIFENKGDETDADMRAFGDEHWLERKYWAKVYTDAQNAGIWKGDPLILEDAPPPESEQISQADYEKYISYFQKLQYEPELGYTHQLPDSKTQQYYEMIYKYQHQFGIGWDDGSTAENLSPNVIKYRDMRNESNDYYQDATTMANLVLLNHLLSALDAAFVTHKYNREIKLSLNARPRYVGRELVSVYGLTVTW